MTYGTQFNDMEPPQNQLVSVISYIIEAINIYFSTRGFFGSLLKLIRVQMQLVPRNHKKHKLSCPEDSDIGEITVLLLTDTKH